MSTMCNNALYDLNFIKITVACFMGTGGFWIRYSNGDAINTLPIKEGPQLLKKKTLFL